MMRISNLFMAAALSAAFITSCKKEEPEEKTLAALSTAVVSEVNHTRVTAGGTITATGGANVTNRGVCWSTSPGPNTGNNVKQVGTGDGTFTTQITGLTPNTTYYVRAYAINEMGTAYGDERSFTTATVPWIMYAGTKLYVHPTDNASAVEYGSYGTATGAGSATDGEANTALLDSVPGIAAGKTCAELSAYGYDDWYLPAEAEWTAIDAENAFIGNFTASGIYWSSTEVDAWGARYQAITGGVLPNTGTTAKNNTMRCRCVRKD